MIIMFGVKGAVSMPLYEAAIVIISSCIGWELKCLKTGEENEKEEEEVQEKALYKQF